MCDYSLKHVKSRPASVGDKLTTKNFGTGSRGFAPKGDPSTAVCVLPGTEIAFAKAVTFTGMSIGTPGIGGTVAIFRQVNKELPHTHHDALEFPNGQVVLLTNLDEGQEATVIQMPADPKTLAERNQQERVPVYG